VVASGMALAATVYRLQIDLSDVDRGVYQALDLRLARHPSESMAFLLTRVIAYCLCHEEGITFSKAGLSDPDEPPVGIRDLQGVLHTWIDVGTPSAERLHKASKACARVVVFTQHDPAQLQQQARDRPIHRGEAIEIYALDPSFLEALATLTDRNTRWSLTHTEGVLYITAGDQNLSTAITRHSLTAATPPAERK
jgi:uncharacterized protein YaeQ